MRWSGVWCLLAGVASAHNWNESIIRGISWFGFETERRDLMCLWTHDLSWNLNKMQELGFNSIRLPFSYDFVNSGQWDKMDQFFSAVQNTNLTVVLDFHRIEDTHQSAKPFNDLVTFDKFLEAWNTILGRYHTISNLVAVDVFNEWQGGQDTAVEWSNIARQIVAYIEKRYPARFTYYVGGTQWGGNIRFVDLDDLPYAKERIRYTIHMYWFSIAQEPFESGWDWSFGDHDRFVVNVGEWGFISSDNTQTDWAIRFIAWLKKKGIRNSYIWTYSYNSGDTQGILKEDCHSVDEKKMSIIWSYWEDAKRRLLRLG
jgi:endoglucanase